MVFAAIFWIIQYIIVHLFVQMPKVDCVAAIGVRCKTGWRNSFIRKNQFVMVTNLSSAVQQPVIAKYVQPYRNGIQSYNLSRHAIGMVLRGKKYIYSGDVRQEINRGDLFFLATGNHYIEDQPETNRPFEQIMFYYTPAQLASILSQLSITYHLNISNDHSCAACREQNYVVCEATNTLRNFFISTNQYIKDELFNHDETAENLKMTELIYLIVSQDDSCIKSKVMDNADTCKESFEQIIYAHIFEDIAIEELARMCNRSLTSFKKEFKKHFSEPPHRWFIKQRLMHARLLLISTNKSISEVGLECGFPNTSHFIKLFKKAYGHTPVGYRHRHVYCSEATAAANGTSDDQFDHGQLPIDGCEPPMAVGE